MEKLVLKGKKEIRLLLVDSLHQTVQALVVNKSKKKTERVINKASRKIATLVAAQMKRELKKIKNENKKKGKASRKKKPEKIKVEPVLETA
jgi:diphthamide synthase subunit DPH2